MLVTDCRLICALEMGNRLPKIMEEQFRSMAKTGVTIPSLSHYARYELI
jgi:hypothetical protein